MRHCTPIAAALVAGACLACSAAAQTGSRIEWIDVHVHLIVGGRGDFAGAVGAAVAMMDDAGIRSSVVMPPPFTDDVQNRHDAADFRGLLQAYPGRFGFLGGGGTLNLTLQRTAGRPIDAQTRSDFERTAREILDAGAAGFGEIAVHHLSLLEGHPYEWIPADHPLLLVLADIAAERDAVVDLHLDVVPRDSGTPARFGSRANPRVLRANLESFEKLLAHNRKARIVWAHAGSDPLGNRTASLCRELLLKHSNLYMSLRLPAGLPAGAAGAPQFAMDGNRRADPGWLALVVDFPDRFVLGGDQFIASPAIGGQGPGLTFAQRSPAQRDMARSFLEALPAGVARKLALENAQRLYGLRP
jgi:hypothetical protein